MRRAARAPLQAKPVRAASVSDAADASGSSLADSGRRTPSVEPRPAARAARAAARGRAAVQGRHIPDAAVSDEASSSYELEGDSPVIGSQRRRQPPLRLRVPLPKLGRRGALGDITAWRCRVFGLGLHLRQLWRDRRCRPGVPTCGTIFPCR